MEPVKELRETVAMDLGALLDAGDGAVVTLVAGETQLAAHRAVLADRSPVLAAMFSHDMLEANRGLVTIPDIEGPVLRQMLVYMYTLRAPQLSKMAAQLLVAADKYGLSGLKSICEQHMAAQLSVETAAATAVLAVRHSCTSLQQAAVAFIKAHTHRVMVTQGWRDAVLSDPHAVVEFTNLVGEASPEISTAGKTTMDMQNRTPVTAASSANPPRDGTVVSDLRSLSRQEKDRRLIVATEQGSIRELLSLLAAGADVGARDRSMCTALHIAALRGHLDVARFLLNYGAEVNARMVRQSTPLHFAAVGDDTAMVRLLLTHAADPNAVDVDGDTPLHDTAIQGHAAAAALLLEGGADRAIRNNRGQTPVDLARANNKQHMVEMLS